MQVPKKVKLDDYLLSGVIGRGSNSKVHLGRKKKEKKEFVAIKLIDKHKIEEK